MQFAIQNFAKNVRQWMPVFFDVYRFCVRRSTVYRSVVFIPVCVAMSGNLKTGISVFVFVGSEWRAHKAKYEDYFVYVVLGMRVRS